MLFPNAETRHYVKHLYANFKKAGFQTKELKDLAGGDRYQVECGLGNQHVVNLVENSCFCKNWDLTGIPCMHAVVDIHQKDEYPKNFVKTWYTKQTRLAIFSNFIRPVKGPKQWESVPDMLHILPPTLKAT
ncbi:hypothetical protein Goarm_012686 [Gossypium armourianum]|uniref:SWIM-type domain-containing protein n=1 Tax=Gossypium armourianum TaxID=34283 RepID=A0A7J9J0Q5_9ROSI|nr:hypothetical protein [Gossypium armourianum]